MDLHSQRVDAKAWWDALYNHRHFLTGLQTLPKELDPDEYDVSEDTDYPYGLFVTDLFFVNVGADWSKPNDPDGIDIPPP